MDEKRTANDVQGTGKAKEKIKQAKNLIKVYNDYLLKLSPSLRENATQSIYNMSFDEFTKLIDSYRLNFN